MKKLQAELETVYGGKKALDAKVKKINDGRDRDTDLKRYASAIKSGDPLSPEMKKLQAELETVYGGKKALDAKVKKINAGQDKANNKKTKQVHQRNVNELGMIEAKPEETVIQKCRRCGTEKKTTHIFIEEGGERKIVIDTCYSRRLTPQCQHVMQVKSGIKPQPPTISRQTIIKKTKEAAAVVSSDEPSSSGVDTDTCALHDSLPGTRAFKELYAMIQKAQSDLSLIEKEILPKKRKLRLRLTHNAKRDNATSLSDSEQSQGTKRKFGTELQQETLQLSNDSGLDLNSQLIDFYAKRSAIISSEASSSPSKKAAAIAAATMKPLSRPSKQQKWFV